MRFGFIHSKQTNGVAHSGIDTVQTPTPTRQSQPHKHRLIRPLAARLLGYVLLFSGLLVVAAAGIQIYNGYFQARQDLVDMQRQAANMLAPTIANNVWFMSLQEAENNLSGLAALPLIEYAQVKTMDGRVIETGKPVTGSRVEQTFPLLIKRLVTHETENVGTLTLASSMAQIDAQLASSVAYTIGLQSLIVLLGVLGLLLIVRWILTRHIETVADYANTLTLDALIAPLKLHRKTPRKPDELSELERALNQMRSKLLEETSHMRRRSVQSQEALDETVRVSRSKNQFLINVSHELRIPLQSALGYATLLANSQLDDEQREYAETLKRSAENLSSIINDLLDISRMESGQMTLHIIPFDLRETLNDVLLMMGPKAREKNLPLEMRVSDELPATLLGDPVRLRQILLNLVANAIALTDSGHVLINLERLGQEHQAVSLRISVEDTGIGIAEADLASIYEPYVQLGRRLKRLESASGIGLTISHRLITAMGGKLGAESRPGQGSTFWIELSLPIAADTSTRTRGDFNAIQGKRILIADAYELSRKITLELVARAGAHLSAVRSAEQALETLREASEMGAPFDAVIVDGFLQDMDSDLFCNQVRHATLWQETRLLVLSSNPQRGDAEHFRESGADAFLSKTLRETRLLPLLQNLFNDRAQNKRLFLTRFSLQPTPHADDSLKLSRAAMRILLVEDNPVNRTLTKRLLEKLGCDVTTAEDGESASELWVWRHFDVILMDCMMPRLDGFEATRRLREWEKAHEKSPTPVVALTASASEADEDRCRRAGMNAFIAKPVTLDFLRSVLEGFSQPDQQDSPSHQL